MCAQKSAWALEKISVRDRELGSNLYYQYTGEFKAVEATKPVTNRGRRMIKRKKEDSHFFYTKKNCFKCIYLLKKMDYDFSADKKVHM